MLVLDPALLTVANVKAGLKAGGVIIVNTKKSAADVRKTIDYTGRLAVVHATHIAMEVLGRPITNTTMLGALLKATGVLPLDSMREPLEERFGRIAARNYAVMERAFGETAVENGR